LVDRDKSVWSFVIALNEEFDGGGENNGKIYD
jgi:hypothetical protein